jgi:RNA polymerase sigma-70 factor (ECF subfamily)
MPTHHVLAQEADAMKRYAITLTRDVHTADDLVQDCMERALRK